MVELLSGEAGSVEATHDPAFSRVLVVVNARPDAHSLPWPPGELASSRGTRPLSTSKPSQPKA